MRGKWPWEPRNKSYSEFPFFNSLCVGNLAFASSWIRKLILKQEISISLAWEALPLECKPQGPVLGVSFKNGLKSQAHGEAASKRAEMSRPTSFREKSIRLPFSDEKVYVMRQASEKGLGNHFRLPPEDRLNVIKKSATITDFSHLFWGEKSTCSILFLRSRITF